MKITVIEIAEIGNRKMERRVEIEPAPQDLSGEPVLDLAKIAHLLHEKLNQVRYQEPK